ncbi:ejaculatory bulb-specific protein 3-like [Phymastichus coffea]|uniref:ejaculatory bulb-specific protein 3-like n=1 Tax=Phymastichus coffea TaxID=108790 RepID=UPI00273ABB14|nr:ejaculatory bulb-specific protein 3-like [Phymastichus coffea]
MKVILFMCLAFYAVASEELYSDQYDYVDVDKILSDDNLREQYYNCYMGNSVCVTPDAQYFKEILPEAALTKCVKCTNKQKENFEKIAAWFTKNQPDKWEAYTKKAVEFYNESKKA